MASRVQSLIALAEKQLNQNNPQLALQTLSEVIKLSPDDAYLYEMLAMANYEYYRQTFNKDYLKTALINIDESIKLNADSPSAFHLKALILSVSNSKKARDAVNQAIALNPNYSEFYVTLGFIEISANITNFKAVKNFEMALSLDPENISALIWLAKMEFFKRGNFVKAEEYAKRAYEIDGGSIEILTLMGNILLKKGQYEDAKNFARQAVAINPRDYDALKLISLIQAKKYFIVDWFFRNFILARSNKVIVAIAVLCLWILVTFQFNLFGLEEVMTYVLYAVGILGWSAFFIRRYLEKKLIRDYFKEIDIKN